MKSLTASLLLALGMVGWGQTPNLPGDKPCPANYHFSHDAAGKLVCAPRAAVSKSKPKSVPRINAAGDLIIPDSKLMTGNEASFVTACARESDMNCIGVLGITADVHGCLYPFNWDGSLCSLNLAFPAKGPQQESVLCTHDPEADGAQHLRCSYKPVSVPLPPAEPAKP